MSAPKRPRQDSDDWTDDYQNHLNECITDSNQHTTDFSFICGKGAGEVRFPVNTNILCTKSDEFKVMFQNRLLEDNEIRFGDISSDVFNAFLRLFTNKPFAMDFDVIVDVMKLSNRYKVGDYLKFCYHVFIESDTSVESVINALDEAVKNNFRLIALEKWIQTEILNSERLYGLRHSQLKRIVQICNMKIDAAVLFDACYKWAENDGISDDIKCSFFGYLGDSIEFGAMSLSDITERAVKITTISKEELKNVFIIIANRRPSLPNDKFWASASTIGTITSLQRIVELDSMEKLCFSPKAPLLFYGIKIADVFHYATIADTKQFTVIVSVIQVEPSLGNIVLLKESFTFEASPTVKRQAQREMKFKEAVVLTHNSKIIVQIRFYACDSKYSHYMCKIDASDGLIFILHDETNTKIITDLYCETR